MKRKQKSQRQHHPKPKPQPRKKPAAPAPPPVTAIVKGTERTLKATEIQLLRNGIAKNCSDEEFFLFMTVCKKKKLDPFTNQVYAIKFGGKDPRMVIIIGVNGFRSMAARSHKRDFGGTTAATFTWPATKEITPAGRRIPESATVEAFRRSGARGSATVYWEEFAPVDLRSDRSDFWNRMPKQMLGKCAEVHALKKVFPDLSDIYSEEELSQRLQDFTPGGREISHAGVAPSGKQLDEGWGQKHLAAQEIAAAKNRGDWCEKHHCPKIHCPADEHTEAENEALFQHEQEKKTIDVKPQNASKGPAQKSGTKGLPAGCTLMIGTIHRVIYGTTKEKHVPYINVQIGQDWHTIWSKTLHTFFPSEVSAAAKVIECWIDKSKNIAGIRRLGPQYFREDGRTPIPREPGAEG